MSRCRRTESLLTEVFADRALTHEQREHALACSECARVVALTRRFERELQTAVAGVVPESINTAVIWSNDPPVAIRGGHDMWRRTLIAMASVTLAAVVVVVGSGVWRCVPWLGGIFDAPIRAGQLNGWLDRALTAAHADAQWPVSPIADWEPAQVETCGGSAIAFFVAQSDRGAYLWAAGKPDDLFDRSIATGATRTLGEREVARRRAELPVCSVVVAEPLAADEVVDGLPFLVDGLPFDGDGAARVAGLAWMGDPNDAPVDVDVIGGGSEPAELGIFSDPYLLGRVSDPAIRAVDVLTPDGRYRYPAAAPGFMVVADGIESATHYEYLDSSGRALAGGAVLDWERTAADIRAAEQRREQAEAQAEAQAQAPAAAEHARRALENGEAGYGCGDWQELTDGEQLAVTAVVVRDLEAARVVQQLPTGTPPERIIAAARESLDKGCQGATADRTMVDIALVLYGR